MVSRSELATTSVIYILLSCSLYTALSHSTSTSNFVRAPQEVLKWENRKGKILEEILRSGADIVCLEEVDHFPDFFQPKLSENGFKGIFKPKQPSPCLNVDGNNGPDGCVLFYRADMFSCVEKQELSLRNKDGAETNQVAILIKLELHSKEAAPSGSDSRPLQFCVAVTHLKAKPSGINLRTAQASYLFSEMRTFCGGLPGVVCGDFNARSTEPAYAHFKEWMESAYFTANNGKEPALTSWKIRLHSEAKYTIDYIWYTAQQLRVKAVWDIPTEEEIGENALPGWTYPSDHVALCARIALCY